MRPTLHDIARVTGTSVSTVSRVLAGGEAAHRISDPTRRRVRDAAVKLGYRPNLLARSLRTRRSHTIALLVSDIGNPFFGRIASLVEQALHRHGYSLMLCNSGEDREREAEYLQLLMQKSIDGLILVPMTRSRQALHKLINPTLPLVILDRPIKGIEPVVNSDEQQSAHALCDTLERCGIRTVVLVSGPADIVTHRTRAEIFAQRFRVIARHEGPAQPETGREAFIRFLSLHPDAYVCTNNFLGQGVIDAIAQIDCPPVIAAFDEIPMMHLLPLPIACSLQDIPMLADACVRQLLPQLQGQDDPPLAPITLPVRIVTNRAFQVRHFRREQEGGRDGNGQSRQP